METSLADMPGPWGPGIDQEAPEAQRTRCGPVSWRGCVHHAVTWCSFPLWVRVSWTRPRRLLSCPVWPRVELRPHRGSRSQPHKEVQEREGCGGLKCGSLLEAFPSGQEPGGWETRTQRAEYWRIPCDSAVGWANGVHPDGTALRERNSSQVCRKMSHATN